MNETGHINNLYNTTFWNMIQKGGQSNTDAELELKVGIISYTHSFTLDIYVYIYISCPLASLTSTIL